MAEIGHNVTGIDYVKDALNKADERARDCGVSIDLKHGNAENILKDIQKNKYDVILCLEVLYGNARYKSIMKYMKKLLSSNGVMLCSHKTKFYFITTLLCQGRYKHALRVAKCKEGLLPIGGRPVYYNWQTTSDIKELYREIGMRLLGMHPIGMFSGLNVDGMSEIANPETMGEREKEVLFDLETEDLGDYVATGRYILTASSKK